MQFRARAPVERRIRILLLVLLASSVLLVKFVHFREANGKDFLQYWGVGKAQAYSGHRLGNPYVESNQYYQVLKDAARNSGDRRFQEAEATRDELVLNQTPLCYLLFAGFPADYSLSLGIFWVFATLLFLASFVLMSSVYRGDWFRFLFLGFILVMIYDPLLSDLGAGNLNAVQLFCLTLALWLAKRLKNSLNLLPLAIAFSCLLVFLTLLKPNLVLISVLLGACLWACHGVRVFAPAALAGAAFGSILLLLSCLRFHSWEVWLDWFKYARSLDHATLLSWIKDTNFAPAILLSKAFGNSLSGTVAGLAAGLAALMALALLLARHPGDQGPGGWRRAVGRALRDPNLCASAGVVVLLMVSPLVWSHYYVLALLPALWLLSRRGRRLANLMGGINIFLTSGVPVKMIPMYFWGQWIPWFYALCSAPLLIGMLSVLSGAGDEGEE